MTEPKNHASDATAEAREQLRKREGVQFVDREEFCELLVSCESLKRCDIPSARIRGVQNSSAGRQYFIEEERLFRSSSTQ